MIALLLVLAVIGWTAILTRGLGPWRVLARARDAWPAGPLGCPLCCGTWVGALAAALYLAAAHWPTIATPALALAAAGAGALVSEAYARALELIGEIAYLARVHADKENQ